MLRMMYLIGPDIKSVLPNLKDEAMKKKKNKIDLKSSSSYIKLYVTFNLVLNHPAIGQLR